MSASCATSAVSSLSVIRRASASICTTVRTAAASSSGGTSSSRPRPPTRVLRTLAQLRQPQKDASSDRLLLGRQALVKEALRGPGNRAAHPAGLSVGLQSQSPTAPPAPRLEERVRQ